MSTTDDRALMSLNAKLALGAHSAEERYFLRNGARITLEFLLDLSKEQASYAKWNMERLISPETITSLLTALAVDPSMTMPSTPDPKGDLEK